MTTYPTSDNCCTRMGWIEAFASKGAADFHFSHAPDADLDGRFPAWDHDEQEMIRINGWMMEGYEVVEGEGPKGRGLDI